MSDADFRMARYALRKGEEEPIPVDEELVEWVARAIRNERKNCQIIALEYGGRDADAIGEMIGERNFRD